MAATASTKIVGTLRMCAAAAAPAATNASAAGNGNPSASPSATRKISRYPCCETELTRLFIQITEYMKKGGRSRLPEANDTVNYIDDFSLALPSIFTLMT